MGLVHIYHGDGKGKTTTSIGLSIRALGAGFNVIFVQFLKGGVTAELEILKNLPNIEIIRNVKDYPFTWLLNDEQKANLTQDHNEILDKVVSICAQTDKETLLVLDEMCATYKLGLIDKSKVIELIKNKKDNLEIVMTGREPEPELKDLADYISEIRKEKHPMDKGIMARKGIES